MKATETGVRIAPVPWAVSAVGSAEGDAGEERNPLAPAMEQTMVR